MAREGDLKSENDSSSRARATTRKGEEKQRLELEALRLANLRAERELAAFGRPTWWDLTKNLVGFFGILVPVMISVFTYLGQRQAELEQQQAEAMQTARKMIEGGDRSAGVLQLSTFGEPAIPYLLGEIRINAFSVEWPSSSLAAIAGLKRIGVEKLKQTDKEYLKQQAELALSQSETFMKMQKPELEHEVLGRLAIIKGITSLVGEEGRWRGRIEKAETWISSRPKVRPAN